MSGFAWLGVIISSFISTLALASWIVMAVPYFDDAPYLTDLRKHVGLAVTVGLLMFAIFFAIFYLAALYLDQDTSGPLIAIAAVIVALPIGMLLGTETWDRYDGHGMNKVPALQAVTVATGIGLAELGGFTVIFILMFQIT